MLKVGCSVSMFDGEMWHSIQAFFR